MLFLAPQLYGYRAELIQRRLQVIGDFLSENIRLGQVFGVLKALVLEPEDVEIELVALEQFLVIESAPAALLTDPLPLVRGEARCAV
jgi:hypothetical protein